MAEALSVWRLGRHSYAAKQSQNVENARPIGRGEFPGIDRPVTRIGMVCSRSRRERQRSRFATEWLQELPQQVPHVDGKFLRLRSVRKITS